jgi:hypothetical protein
VLRSITYESFDMLKDSKGETPEQRAQRKWRNKELSERFKRAKETGEGAEDFLAFDGKKPHINAEVPKPPKDPEIASVIRNDGKRDVRINRFENKFKKDIRAMMEGHSATNLHHYLAYLERRKIKLLSEKLRRLQLAEQEQEQMEVGK